MLHALITYFMMKLTGPPNEVILVCKSTVLGHAYMIISTSADTRDSIIIKVREYDIQ